MRVKEKAFEMTDSEYRDVLDDIYGTVEICGMTYDSGRALEELDPTAFRVGMADYEAEQPSKWECGECGTEYDDEDDAEECCKEECKLCGELCEDLKEHAPECPEKADGGGNE